MIQLKNIEIGYATPLFSIENLELLKGNVYSLIGANGSGKTTFLQSLQGNIKTIKGSVEIDHKNVITLDRNTKAKTIAFVNSKFDGIDYLKVYDYISLGRIPYTNALGRLSTTDKSIINDAIKELKIEKLSHLYTNQLSDGERQLAAIARAITQETAIIILDEPTAFLDYANRKLVMNEMKKIASQLNKCIIISSHDLELCIESESDILIIDKKVKTLKHFKSKDISKSDLIEIGF